VSGVWQCAAAETKVVEVAPAALQTGEEFIPQASAALPVGFKVTPQAAQGMFEVGQPTSRQG